MSDSHAQIKAGLFVTAGLAVVLFSILMVSGGNGLFKSYNDYHLRFSTIQGLAAGSVVSLSGMTVGNVTSIEFDNSSAVIVDIKIDKKFAPRITKSVIATIRTQGALGDRYIFLLPGPADDPSLAPNEFIKTESSPDLLDIISEKANDLQQITDLAREMRQLVHNLNADGRSAQLVENMNTASQSVAKLMNEPKIRNSLSYLESILRKIDNSQGTLGALVNDPSLHDRLMDLLGETPRNKYLKPLIRETIKQKDNK